MRRNGLHPLWCVCTGMVLLLPLPRTVAQTPDPPAKEPNMAADASPSFLVAAITPSAPDATGGWSFESEGHHISCVRATLMDIVAVAYSIQARQIAGGPRWFSTDRYDIHGTPDVPGVPNFAQTREMYRKLLAERFHLVVHEEQREMPIYALTVAKGGPRLKVADPGETTNAGNSGSTGQRTMKFTNMSMPELALNLDFYQDRPVVDQTSLPGRYDFTLKWSYDISVENESGAPPSLYTALREQLACGWMQSKVQPRSSSSTT